MPHRNTPLTPESSASLAWEKMDDLLPAIVQDRGSGRVLMVAYMNREALGATLQSGLATFFSRSKQRLWQKGETSGNQLKVHAVFADCDGDALLVIAEPSGPTCHLGTVSCFGNDAIEGPGWLAELARVVRERDLSGNEASYTRKLLLEGPARIAQKVGEEGVEVALAAVTREAEGCAEEVADLIYHLTVLMHSRRFGWDEVIALLRSRHATNRHHA